MDDQKDLDQITENRTNIAWLKRIVWLIVAGAAAKLVDYLSQ
jgi:hypothetical protein